MLANDSPDALLGRVRAVTEKVNSYVVELNIVTDIHFLKAPQATGTFYYKKPDRTKLISDGFAILPREGAGVQSILRVTDNVTAIDGGMAKIGNRTLRKIRVIPNDEKAPFVVASVFIDTTSMLIYRAETTIRSGGVVVLDLDYGDNGAAKYGLPSAVKMTVDIGDFSLPKSLTGDFSNKHGSGKKGDGKARLNIRYSNYRINVPINESVFTQP